MEDQLFAIHAYARARSISVAADRPWYFYNRRDDDGHLTSERVDPERHFRNLRTVLDLVDAETEPGAVRDRIVRRMLRVEVLNRVSEPVYPLLSDEDRARLFAGARDIVRERISTSVIGDLGAVRRQRCELLRDDRPAELLAMARALADVDLSATLVRAAWNDGALELTVTAGLVYGSTGAPLRVDDGQGSAPASEPEAQSQPYVVTGDPSLIRIQLVLRSRPSVLDWYIPAPGEPARDRVGASAQVRIDPTHVGAGATPMTRGSWDVLVRLSGLGIERSAALRADPADAQGALRPALFGSPARVVVPVVDHDGLVLEVDPPSAVLARALDGWPIRVIRDGVRLAIDLPMTSGGGTAALPASLVVSAPDGDRILPARLVPHRGRVVLESTADRPRRTRAGPIPGRTPARRSPRIRRTCRWASQRSKVDGSSSTASSADRRWTAPGPTPAGPAPVRRRAWNAFPAGSVVGSGDASGVDGGQGRRRSLLATERYQRFAVFAVSRPNVCFSQIWARRR